jgi:hypothetical protein
VRCEHVFVYFRLSSPLCVTGTLDFDEFIAWLDPEHQDEIRLALMHVLEPSV